MTPLSKSVGKLERMMSSMSMMSLNVGFYVIACCLGSLAKTKVPLAVSEAMTAEHRAERNAFVLCVSYSPPTWCSPRVVRQVSRGVAFGATVVISCVFVDTVEI